VTSIYNEHWYPHHRTTPMTSTSPEPTIAQIIAAVGDTAKASRDGTNVVVGYGAEGFLRLFPSWIYADDRTKIPSVRIDGKLMSGTGGAKERLRKQLRSAGIEIG